MTQTVERKRVRFTTEHNEEFEHNGCPLRASALWYSPREFSGIKSMAYAVAKESRHTQIARVLGMIYDRYEAIDDAQDKLDAWVRHAQLRRGLETWISKDFRRQRQGHKEFVVEAVLASQQRARQIHCNEDEKAELIARFCLPHTTNASRFAAMTGLADERAARAPTHNGVSPRSSSMVMCRRRSSTSVSKYPAAVPASPRTVVTIHNPTRLIEDEQV